MTNTNTAPSPVIASSTASIANGLDIATSVQLLRHYHTVERRSIRICAGWFLLAPAYETKYRLAYHAWDHVEHVSWIRARLTEMRGGQPDASVSPALRTLMDEALHAPDTDSMLRGLYGVIKRALLQAYQEHLVLADSSANACEVRLIKRIIPEIEAQLAWYDSLKLETGACAWQEYIRGLLRACGGISGRELTTGTVPIVEQARQGKRFERPRSIHFDSRIRIGALTPYDVRQKMDRRMATIEQFKVFFNELYAAALLASILFDSFDDNNPWEYYVDFCHHFWDEARHSEFGSLRLKELGEAPSVCNPQLFEQTEGLPVLHRICYLTLGLEVYFMPRKQPRVREYQANGDSRSQLFADQDWSDETNHVRYGKKWLEHMLEDDQRTIDDIQEEVRVQLERITGKPQTTITAPY
jgi:hypothetical protein